MLGSDLRQLPKSQFFVGSTGNPDNWFGHTCECDHRRIGYRRRRIIHERMAVDDGHSLLAMLDPLKSSQGGGNQIDWHAYAEHQRHRHGHIGATM